MRQLKQETPGYKLKKASLVDCKGTFTYQNAAINSILTTKDCTNDKKFPIDIITILSCK